jgi:predicted regulator of Ras-like GTPase activity (Roadblock/LC7/MglB family)
MLGRMHQDPAEVLFQQLTLHNSELVAALIVEPTGRVRTSGGLAPEVAKAATALAVPARDLLERVCAELGCGALRAVLIEGDHATLAFADIDGASTAVLVGATGAAAGALRADAIAFANGMQTGRTS